jgi:hypothetical protein
MDDEGGALQKSLDRLDALDKLFGETVSQLEERSFSLVDGGFAAPVSEVVDFAQALRAVRQARVRALEVILRNPSLQASPALLQRARALRDGGSHWIDQYLGQVPDQMLPEGYSVQPLTDDFLERLLSPAERSQVMRRHLRCGTLLLPGRPRKGYQRHLSTARRCFALGLFDAAVAFCRSLVETAAVDALRASDQPQAGNVSRIEERRDLNDIIRLLQTRLPGEVVQRADAVRQAGNKVLHSRGEKSSCTEDDALKALLDTFSFIELALSPKT